MAAAILRRCGLGVLLATGWTSSAAQDSGSRLHPATGSITPTVRGIRVALAPTAALHARLRSLGFTVSKRGRGLVVDLNGATLEWSAAQDAARGPVLLLEGTLRSNCFLPPTAPAGATRARVRHANGAMRLVSLTAVVRDLDRACPSGAPVSSAGFTFGSSFAVPSLGAIAREARIGDVAALRLLAPRRADRLAEHGSRADRWLAAAGPRWIRGEIETRDLRALERLLARAGVPFRRVGDFGRQGVEVELEEELGIDLVFLQGRRWSWWPPSFVIPSPSP